MIELFIKSVIKFAKLVFISSFKFSFRLFLFFFKYSFIINSLPCHIQNNVVYDVEGNKNGYNYGYSSDFSISCSYNINYSYLFQSTDGLCSKLKFKFALGSIFHKL